MGKKEQHYFAFKLDRILTLTALGGLSKDYLANYQRNHIDFITSLINPRDERFTYELRYISHPCKEFYIGGDIEIYFICRVDEVSKDEVQRYAFNLLNLLDSTFDEYIFKLIDNDEGIKRVLEPFSIKQLLVISRRVERERLDILGTSQRRARVGFIKQEETIPFHGDLAQNEILHIYPFLPNLKDFSTLFKLLLLESMPIAISVKFKPTSLTEDEIRFFEGQIAKCENFVQSVSEQVLREQAQLYKALQIGFLHGLKDNACIMNIMLASPEKIPQPIIETFGTLITQPAGISGDYLRGGYEIFEPADTSAAIEAFKRMDVIITPNPLVPSDVKRSLYLFDSAEAIAAFRFPPSHAEGYLGISCQGWRSQPLPKECPKEGCFLGVNVHKAHEFEVRLGDEDRKRHVYIVGQTGTGKTTLLKTMIMDDMRRGKGLCVIDPHGDLFKELLGKIPKERIEDVVLLDPTDRDYPVGFNMLEWGENKDQRYFLAQEMVSIITKLIEDEYGVTSGQFTGPIFFQHMRMNLLLVMSNPDDPGTLLEFYNIFQDNNYWRRWSPPQVTDPLLDKWVENVLPEVEYTSVTSNGISVGDYVGSKFQSFVFDPMLRNIFGQKRSTINLREIMDEGKILLVNLAKGELTEANSRFFGMTFLAKFMAVAMERIKTPEHQRREFILYVDEFQSFATQSFITLLSEARKFGVSLVLANQFISQIKDERIPAAIFGNVGTIICFRLGQADAQKMEIAFLPFFNASDLMNLPNWYGYMKTLINGVAVKPFTIKTVPDDIPFDREIAERVRSSSRKKYGRKVSEVEKEIEKSLMK